jgi:fatty acid desaturase
MNGRLEWPTLGLAMVIYAGWIAATLLHDRLHPLALAAIGGWLTAWHGSLQHETIHGHPTPWRRVNAAVAAPPLSLWLPYEIYRRSHLAHHDSANLTHPHFDPEARYLDGAERAGSRLGRGVARLQATLAGRMVIGPFVEFARFARSEAGRVVRGEGEARRIWSAHLVATGLVLAWICGVCGMSLGEYLLCFVYPGAALSLVRSFAEHRASPVAGRRVAVVERAPLLGLLFLHNNLHAVHHAQPGLAWWRLPAHYRRTRAAVLAANGGLVYAGYREVFARFLFRAHDQIVHPEITDRPQGLAA